MEMIKGFAKSESGAVTVDWVVLTAAIVGLGIAVMAVVSNGVESLSGDIALELDTQNANDNPFLDANQAIANPLAIPAGN